MSKKIIITCAVTGASMTPSMSPYLPITPAEIAEQAVAAAAAGAAVLHLHARDPKDGQPSNEPEIWAGAIDPIRAQCDAIVNMSASLGATPEERVRGVMACMPEIATVIVGSMNYGNFRKAEEQGIVDYKHAWERESFFGAKSYEVVTNNNFAKIARTIELLDERGIAIEFECYDVGHLYTLAYHLDRHPLKGPVIVQFLTGILGGIPSDIDHLLHMKRTAERLFGDQMQLFIHGTGMVNIRTAAHGALMGTHLRVGQEDNLFDRPGVLFKSNAEQVTRIRTVLEALNIEIATPAEARAQLGLAAPASAAH
jgi:uncharacterized protein (DUF849 family)